MNVLVTGATGFVGANVARLLLIDGHRVKVLARPASSLRALEGCAVEVVRGDIREADSVARAIQGCRQVFHVAADYRLWARDPGEIYRNNVDRTRTVLEMCAEARVERGLHLECRHARAAPRRWSRHRDHAGQPMRHGRSLQAVEVPRRARRGGVCGSRSAGRDRQPKQSHRSLGGAAHPDRPMILDYLLGRMFATLDTGLNLVHVADVARGHLLAAQRGRGGEKYILGCQNLSLTEIFHVLEHLTGIRAPRVRMPYALIYLLALADEGAAPTHGRPPRVPPHA